MAKVPGTGGVLHMVVDSIDVEYVGEPKPGGLTNTYRGEVWVDPASGRTRLVQSAKYRHVVVFRGDTLVEGGVVQQIIAQADGMRKPAGTGDLLVTPETPRSRGSAQEPLGTRETDVLLLEEALRSHQLKDAGLGIADGQPARHVVGDYHPYGMTKVEHFAIDAWLRVGSTLPIVLKVAYWMPQPGGPNTPINTVALQNVITRHYRVIERMSQARARSAFVLPVPKGTRVIADVYLPLARLRWASGDRVWWLGPQWTVPRGSNRRLAIDPRGLHFQDSPPAPDPSTILGFTSPGYEIQADRRGGPRFSLLYGSMPGFRITRPGVHVVSYQRSQRPRFALSTWPTWGQTFEHITISGHPALIAFSPDGISEVVLQMPYSMACVQSWGMSRADLLDAAKQLREVP